MTEDLLWPTYATPADLPAIEAVPLEARGLPESTYALLAHPQVTAAGAIGRPDVHAGEVPVAYVTLVAGATVTEAELCAWAAERVPERAAAPKAVTVLDALPVTAVGKPYKLALRADVTRRALAEALAGLGEDIEVQTAIEDGAVVAAITIAADANQAAVKARLDQFVVSWSLAVRPLPRELAGPRPGELAHTTSGGSR